MTVREKFLKYILINNTVVNTIQVLGKDVHRTHSLTFALTIVEWYKLKCQEPVTQLKVFSL